MIKLRGHGKDGQVTILGLSEGNFRRLKHGEPIMFNGEDIGLSGKIIIVWGETEASILEELSTAGIKLDIA